MQNFKKLKYQTFKSQKGNKYRIHSTHSGEEFKKNKPILEFLVDNYGGKGQLLPNNITDKKTYNRLMPKGVKEGKHPDAFWNNEIWELKTAENGSKNCLKRNIREAYKQSNNIVIRFDHALSNQEIFRYVKGEIFASSNIQKIWIWKNGKMFKYDRKNIKKQKP